MTLSLSTTNIMTSREIADFTGKQHKDVLEAIRTMEPAWEKVNGRKFPLVQYKDAKGEMRPMYELSKTECLYIATKFNDEARAKLILRWEQLEKQNAIDFNNPEMVLKLAQKWHAEQQARLAVQRENQMLREKTQLMDKVLDADEKIDVGQAAKILQLPFGRNTLFQELRNKGVFFKNRNEPKQQYLDKGYFELKEKFIERNEHDGFVVIKVLVTQKGLAFLSQLFRAEPSDKQLARIG